REGLFEAVTLYRTPVLGVDRLVFPDQRVNQISAQQIGAVNDDPVSVAAERAIHRGEGERLRWRKFETSGHKMAARTFLEVVPAVEDLARPGREHGTTPPIVLTATRTLMSGDRCAQIGTREFRRRCRGALDCVVNRDVDRLEREGSPVQ